MNVKGFVAICLVTPEILLAAVTGVVRNDANKPVAKAFVRFVNAADSSLETAAFTDSLGRYSLTLPGPVPAVWSGRIATAPTLTLGQSRPNPVSSATEIPFSLPRKGRAEIEMVSLGGRVIDRISRDASEGPNFVEWKPSPALHGGVYVYRLRFNGLWAERSLIVVGGARESFSPGIASVNASPVSAGAVLKKVSAPLTYNIFVYGRGVFPSSSGPVAIADGATMDFGLKYSDLWDSCRIILRDSLVNSRYQFQVNKKGLVAFLGGSITNMSGWRDSVTAYLSARFPQTVFTFVNAGIPSVGSNMHAFRIQRDIFSAGPVDLLFVEAAVNDTTNNIRDNINRTARLRAMEGIVRQARANNPNIDIVSMDFADTVFYPSVKASDSIPFLDCYERPAWHYGVSTINLSQYVAERYTWAQFGANVHPAAFGMGIYANEIRRLFNTAWKDSLPASSRITRHFHPVRLLDTLCYQFGHYDSITMAQVVSGWTYVASWHPTTATTRSGFVDVPALEAAAAGAKFTFGFNGTAVGIVSPEGPDVGMLTYQIDTGASATLDQFTPWSSTIHIPWIWMFATNLTNTHHTLTVTVAATKNASSAGYASRVFEFAVNGR